MQYNVLDIEVLHEVRGEVDIVLNVLDAALEVLNVVLEVLDDVLDEVLWM